LIQDKRWSPDYDSLAVQLSARLERSRATTKEESIQRLQEWSGRDVDLLVLEGQLAFEAWVSKKWPGSPTRRVVAILSDRSKPRLDAGALWTLEVNPEAIDQLKSELCALQSLPPKADCGVPLVVTDPNRLPWVPGTKMAIHLDWDRAIEGLISGRAPFDRPSGSLKLTLDSGFLSLSVHPQNPRFEELKKILQGYSLSKLRQNSGGT